jgi:hypothetical protein
MKTKCYSVKLQSFYQISDKCYKALDFNGNEDLIPASQYFGPDYEHTKSDAYWISAWILEKKNITYSEKKAAWHDSETGRMRPHIDIIIEKHIPERKEPIKTEADASLIK